MGLAEKVDKALDYAVTGYEIAGGVGAVAGASLGLLIGDETTVLPIDMIAIPAYQAYMLQGTPAITLYIKAGESIIPTGGNVADVKEGEAEVKEMITKPKRKRKKRTKWHRFVKNFEYRKRRKNESQNEYLSAKMKAASKAYKKQNKAVKK